MTAAPEIAPAHPEHADALAAIAMAAFSPYAEAIGRLPAPALQDFPPQIAAGHVWIAGAPPLGYLVAFAKSGDWFLEAVAVSDAARGMGLGRRLIAFAEEEGRRRGFARVTLYTNALMTGNLSLYPHLGYAETGRRHEDGFDRVYFAKELR